MASFKPSKMNWIDKAASTTAIILENTCSNFLEIYFSDFKNKINNKLVINNTVNKEAMWVSEYKKFPLILLDETITDVIAAGPASKGIANGNNELFTAFFWKIFSFLEDLLSRSISKEIINKIIPPAILKE